VCFLALPIGKRFRIGLGIGHKILAQTWPPKCEWHVEYYVCIWWIGMD
jgi:hypothetical protein